MNYLRITLGAMMLLMLGHAHAAKTDIIVLANGNAVTGEIKALDFGSLEYSTDSMGTVFVDWEDVVGITSNQQLQVEVSNGARYFGNLESSDERFQINVITLSGSVELETTRIIRITPIHTEESFIQRLEGDILIGYNSQKTTEVSTMNLVGDIRYRTQQYLVGLKANSTITEQTSEETSKRASISGNYQRFKGNRWFTDWFTGWDHDDALGIDQRLTGGGAVGRYVIQTNTHLLSLMGGLQAVHTTFIDYPIIGQEPATKDAEGRIQTRYLYRSRNPDRRVTFTSNVFPLLEDFSHIRADTDLSISFDIISDLYFEVLLFHTYSSTPPLGAEQEDWGITTSIGYSF